MKNREKFAKEIVDIACKGGSVAVTRDNKVVCCNDILCESCMFDSCSKHIGRSQACYDRVRELAESEYVEKPKITLREEKFLSLLILKWKYLVRGKDKSLYVFNSLPIKETDGWSQRNYIIENGTTCDCYYISKKLFGDMFDFIKWEDEEPWSIEDLKNLEVKDE